MNTQINTGTNTLTATRVSDAQRIHFWPGSQMGVD